MKRQYALHSGFTLIEVAIVLLIVTILLGYSVAMFPVQQELKKYRKVNVEIDYIIEQLIAFAQINGRLPCPDTSGLADGGGDNSVIDGLEDSDDGYDAADLSDAYVDDFDGVVDGVVDGCRGYYGFVPARTLGLNGDIDGTGHLLDPWGQAYRYHVADINTDGNGDGDDTAGDSGKGSDFVSPNGIREEGIQEYSTPPANTLLFICDNNTAASGADDTDCTDTTGGATVVSNVAAVIISTGKDAGNVASNIQAENLDDFHNGKNDLVYISARRNDSTGAVYDDVVKWISPNQLISKMIAANQLP